jgi:hypothetical protein
MTRMLSQSSLDGNHDRPTARPPEYARVLESVAITADIHDMAAAQAAIASPSPEDAAAEERHGVIQPITAYIEK